jgi:poly(hydroxyalkanoate) depolymerase family esterase
VAKPPILVNPHACHGKGTDVCGPSGAFAQQADRYGFLVICPSAISSDGCWDVHSQSVLSHDGGGDATGIISMVKWVIQNKNGDADRVYVAGHSSGGMMTNVMLGSYPDVFKAGAAFAGVPFACYAQGSVDTLGWNSNCAQGKVTMDGKAWGDLVRAAYPTFSGPRPRMQIWHGTTDDILFFQNFKEEIKQWTNVFGVSETPTSTENNAIQSSWIRTRYADSAGTVWLEAIQETGQPHNLIVDAAAAVHFFGLDQPAPDGGVKDAAGDVSGAGGTGGSKGGNTGSGSTSSGGSSGGGTRTTSATSSGGASGGTRASTSTEAGGNSGSTARSSSGGQSANGGQSASGGSQTRPVDTGVGGQTGAGGNAGSGGRSSAGGTSSSAGGSSATVASAGGTSKSSASSGSRKSGGCSMASGTETPGGFSLILFTALTGLAISRYKSRDRRGRHRY